MPRLKMSLRERHPPENDPPTACSLRSGWQAYPLAHGKISDDSKLEGMDSSIGGQRHVESLKAEVEEQIEGVLGVFGLLFGPLSTNKLNLSCVFEVAYGS
jgi:hypothetical protein